MIPLKFCYSPRSPLHWLYNENVTPVHSGPKSHMMLMYLLRLPGFCNNPVIKL